MSRLYQGRLHGGAGIMTPDQFEILRDEFLVREARILEWKRNEYSHDEDRLLNFRQVAEFEGRTLAEVALTWLLKHIQSIALAVQSAEYAWAWETEGGEGLKQRIADARNYLLLLAACLEEETEEEKKHKKYPFRGSGNDYQVKYTTTRERGQEHEA